MLLDFRAWWLALPLCVLVGSHYNYTFPQHLLERGIDGLLLAHLAVLLEEREESHLVGTAGRHDGTLGQIVGDEADGDDALAHGSVPCLGYAKIICEFPFCQPPKFP